MNLSDVRRRVHILEAGLMKGMRDDEALALQTLERGYDHAAAVAVQYARHLPWCEQRGQGGVWCECGLHTQLNLIRHGLVPL